MKLWVFFSSGKDCSDIIRRYSYTSGQDGAYTIFLNKVTKRKVFCDMTTDGGGWTVSSYAYQSILRSLPTAEDLVNFE